MCPHTPYWVLQVTVKQEEEDVDASEQGHDFRHYAVAPDKHIRVAIKNLSRVSDISFRCVCVSPCVCVCVYIAPTI